MGRLRYIDSIDITADTLVEVPLTGIIIPDGFVCKITRVVVMAFRSTAGTVNHKDLFVGIAAKDLGITTLGYSDLQSHSGIIAYANMGEQASTTGSPTAGTQELELVDMPYSLSPYFILGQAATIATGPTVNVFMDIDYDLVKITQAIAIAIAGLN